MGRGKNGAESRRRKEKCEEMKNVENIFTLEFFAFSSDAWIAYVLFTFTVAWNKDLKIKFMIYHSSIATTRISGVKMKKLRCMLPPYGWSERVGNREITHEISVRTRRISFPTLRICFTRISWLFQLVFSSFIISYTRILSFLSSRTYSVNRRHWNIWSESVKIFKLIININGRFRIQDQALNNWTITTTTREVFQLCRVRRRSFTMCNSIPHFAVEIIEPFRTCRSRSSKEGEKFGRQNCARWLEMEFSHSRNQKSHSVI